MKKVLNSKKGITLVALVITIIILLILAGVAIAQLQDNGLFEKSKLAKEKAQNAQDLEDSTLGDYENEITSYFMGGPRTGEGNESLYTVLYDGSSETNGGITVASETSEDARRTFTDNVSKYDMLLLYVGSSTDNDLVFPPTVIAKTHFNRNVNYYTQGFSSTLSQNTGKVKIDTQNNKIIYIGKGHSYHRVTTVIGIKY